MVVVILSSFKSQVTDTHTCNIHTQVKATLLGKLLWRVASYRFPVAMGAYVAAALAARFVVGRVQVRAGDGSIRSIVCLLACLLAYVIDRAGWAL